ncbi:MAG: hypothetical protein IJ783_07010, partial [Kiritimatiellae bacterium]|nr:hypothetical protein [Kiritimatiellia bacterium]
DAGPGLEVRAEGAAEAGRTIGPHLFALSGADGVRKWADAELAPDGASILVSSPEVPDPRRVEYGCSDFPPAADLRRRGDGLPLFPFSLEATP